MTMSCSLCVRCLFISWSQVYVLYYQTEMTMVGSSSCVKINSTSTCKVNRTVQDQPLISLAKLKLLAEVRFQKHTWDFMKFRNMPGIACMLPGIVVQVFFRCSVDLSSYNPLFSQILWQGKIHIDSCICVIFFSLNSYPNVITSLQTSHLTNTER